MQSVEDATHMETLSNHSLDGPTNDAMEEEQTLSNKTLYVYPTSERLCEEHLKEIFALFGSIDKLIYTKEEKYGSIVFSNEEDAIKASTIMDGGIIDGKNISVTFYRDFEKYREKMRRNKNRQSAQDFFRGRRGVSSRPFNWRLSNRSGKESKTRTVSRPFNKVEFIDSRKSPVRGRFERERRYVESRRRDSSSPHERSRRSVSIESSRENKLHRVHQSKSHTKRRRASSEESKGSYDSSRHRPSYSRKHSSKRRSHKRRHSSSSNSLQR
ncbi:hypothetical protein GpartN1_g7409.t1 [Galdieria partita]|uniref:RRM domain-containing protein n=1 Tax=Galdieria partita TaxID=83374 RepID=A0A9C7Q362_9RHOD|nr:hypothetical protein GpartN1_g7409.t1 [Galdieria partita]